MTKDDDTRARFLTIESDIKGINTSVADINTNVALLAKSASDKPDKDKVREIAKDVVELERLRELEKKSNQSVSWQKYKPVIKYAIVVTVTTILALLGSGSIPV